jgi:hypothetical protein
MSGGWIAALVAGVVAGVMVAVGLVLLLLRQAIKDISLMLSSIVRSLIGPVSGDSESFDGSFGTTTSSLFDTLPAWQVWGTEGDPDMSPEHRFPWDEEGEVSDGV